MSIKEGRIERISSRGVLEDPDRGRAVLRGLKNNYKLTPGTLAYKLSKELWLPAKHLTFISTKVAQAIAKGNGRIIVSLPPRHGKSKLLTTWTPVWTLEHFPTKKIIVTSYGSDLSTDFGREIRNIIRSNSDLLNSRISKDSGRVAKFSTPQGGSVTSVGMSGAITGRGADVLLVDDYIKELKDALSPTARNQIWNWFTTVAMTRLEPNATVIIVATRWHSDDLIGRLIKHFPDKWDYIRIPAIAEEDDVLGREMGEALFPERISLESLLENRNLLGSIFFDALYQQTPTDESAQIANADWLEVVDSVPYPDRCEFARVWDFAASPQKGDFSVGTLLAHDTKTHFLYIVSVVRKQLSAMQVESLVSNTAVADGRETRIFIEQEPGASGVQLVEHFKTNVLPEFTVIACPTTRSKLIRAQPMLAAAEAGKVKVVRGSWNSAYFEEFGFFPDGDHDDQVDTTAIGYEKLIGKKYFKPVWGSRTARNRVPTTGQRVSGATFGKRTFR